MYLFLAMIVVALVFSSVGFKKYVWFISIGYGLSIAAIGIALMIAMRDQFTAATACAWKPARTRRTATTPSTSAT